MTATMTERGPLNGVNVPGLFATIGAVDQNRELAKFQFRATNTWQTGTYSRTSITSYYGAGQDHEHVREFMIDTDHPMVLVGEDRAPTPVEMVLAALLGCLTAGIGNIASARGVELRSVESSIEGEIDLQGILGLSDEVRNGFQEIRASFRIDGDAPQGTLETIVAQATARSAVFDLIANTTPVTVAVDNG